MDATRTLVFPQTAKPNPWQLRIRVPTYWWLGSGYAFGK